MLNTLTQPYTGAERLVIGIDVGTTSSAVSLSHLQPGVIPIIRTVTSWPDSPTESKLPSLVLFNSSGSPVAFGAECLTPAVRRIIDEAELHLAKWFKLQLHPRQMQFDATATLSTSLGGLNLDSSETQTTLAPIVPDFEVPPLPLHVTIKRVYSSFLAYLLEHTRSWFAEHTLEGGETWNRLIGSAQVVMAIPDGWDEVQQAVMKEALVETGLLGDEVEERLDFLREAEASVHFALKGEEVCEWLQPGALFTAADLGGSTIDVCLYRCEQISPTVQLKEVKLSESVQAGGVFVDRAAQTLVKAKLDGSRFASAEKIDRIVSLFEENTKRRFTGSGEISYIKFGDSCITDRPHGVSMGRLSLSSAEVESTFSTCANEILAAIQQQLRMGSEKASHVIITGGFGDSPYLRARLRRFLEPSGFHLVTSDDQSKKAVAEGAVRWQLSQQVTARAVRASYGASVAVYYKHHDPEHRCRSLHTWPDGLQRVYGAWAPIVEKGAVLHTSASFPESFVQQTTKLGALTDFRENVWIYEGDEPDPRWCEDESELARPGFVRRAEVIADLSPLRFILEPIQKGTVSTKATSQDIARGNAYWLAEFEICLFVAQTSLKAKLTWMEKGIQREGPATVVLVDSADRSEGAQVCRRLPADVVAERA
ncbi:hypothetical protein BCR35DRAFT_354200 [Leucosporidium creatinivorum]|uniref:Actin-like ATPase domain-containing protein n=1 Tax=Leucosporidium creatinivorum TaxID=106004 RepID=A0A1Y2END6_9BASI|nr:hypothetical protein BCR35DRAFT_354200 [Leucosporidium creatinivorum]